MEYHCQLHIQCSAFVWMFQFILSTSASYRVNDALRSFSIWCEIWNFFKTFLESHDYMFSGQWKTWNCLGNHCIGKLCFPRECMEDIFFCSTDLVSSSPRGVAWLFHNFLLCIIKRRRKSNHRAELPKPNKGLKFGAMFGLEVKRFFWTFFWLAFTHLITHSEKKRGITTWTNQRGLELHSVGKTKGKNEKKIKY